RCNDPAHRLRSCTPDITKEPVDAGARRRAHGMIVSGRIKMGLIVGRRQALGLGLGAVASMAVGGAGLPAFAANDAGEVIQKFTDGKAPAQSLVNLELPEIAENGATVPMTVSVDSPMTEQNYVKEMLIVADENPNAEVATFRFSSLGGV